MRLHDLLGATDVLEVLNDSPVDVSDVTHDSRSVRPGALFCCIPGVHRDGHDFAARAVDDGAVALLVDRRVAVAVPQARVQSVRAAAGPISARVHGDPSHQLPVLGVTGTNGKTTTTFLLEAIFTEAGRHPALVGTAGVRCDGASIGTARFTTPEAPDLQRTLADLLARGADVVAIEVSSHALAEQRVDGTRFAAVGFTNLTHEHLDYHSTIEEYFEAKARLFTPEFASTAVINIDDERGGTLAARAETDALDVVSYGIDVGARPSTARVTGSVLHPDPTGTRFRLEVDGATAELRLPIAGRFNVANALAAAGLAHVVGIGLDVIAAGLTNARSVPGRFESVGSGEPVSVVVDYAHTPAGITTVLAAARALRDGRIIAVFGCGGDRDTAKRAGMGAAAGHGADVVVLTTDNPRSEDPAMIAAAAEVGLQSVGADYTIELDRRAAIRAALASAQPGDTVVILGKGAEATQQIGETLVPFDDRLVAAEELVARWN